MTLYSILRDQILSGGLSCIRSKSQLLWLLRSTLDQGETCLDELIAAWFFQGQQNLSKT